MASAEAGAPGPPPGLTWGIKRSFIRYLGMLPDGGFAMEGGAELCAGSYFTFAPAAPCAPGTGDGGIAKFSGHLQLSGHSGLLFVSIADPWIEFCARGAGLSVRQRELRIRIADLELAPAGPQGPWRQLEAQVSLTSEGVELFGGQYQVGEAMDPLFASWNPGPGA